MFLKTVTVTGIDENNDYKDIIEISKEFPFVEWGILATTQRTGSRFPSKKWVEGLISESQSESVFLNLSLHLCGKLSKGFLLGRYSPDWARIIIDEIGFFNRLQVNCDLSESKFDPIKMAGMISDFLSSFGVKTIIQHNEPNEDLWSNLLKYGGIQNYDILFDESCGNGVELKDIRLPIAGYFCGWAGGLNPDNLEDTLENISVLGDGVFWIDAESDLRTSDILDFEKVTRFLEISRGFVV